MVKMKVTTQGEEVINLLWDVIARRQRVWEQVPAMDGAYTMRP